MILNAAQRLLRDQMEVVAYRFLHAETYFHKTTAREEVFWRFTQNCYGEVACLLWCHLFNNRDNDPVHYTKLFGNDQLLGLSSRFSTQAVREHLMGAANLNEATYSVYRDQVKAFRDQYVAHRDYQRGSVIFPDLRPASAMVQALRKLLEESVHAELRGNPGDAELEELVIYYEDHQNKVVLSGCEYDAEKILVLKRR